MLFIGRLLSHRHPVLGVIQHFGNPLPYIRVRDAEFKLLDDVSMLAGVRDQAAKPFGVGLFKFDHCRNEFRFKDVIVKVQGVRVNLKILA